MENKKINVKAKQDIILSGKTFYLEDEVFEIEQFHDTYFLNIKGKDKKFVPSSWIEEIN